MLFCYIVITTDYTFLPEQDSVYHIMWDFEQILEAASI